MLQRITYVSTRTLASDEKSLAEILSCAQRENRRHGITGILQYNGVNFFQIIEGDAQALAQLYANIQKDARHTGVVTLKHEQASERLFPEWHMSVLRLGDDQFPKSTHSRMAMEAHRSDVDRLPQEYRDLIYSYRTLSRSS